MQLLPAATQTKLKLSKFQPTKTIQSDTWQLQARAITGLGFLFFYLRKADRKKQKTQPGATRNEERNTQKTVETVEFITTF